jgi:hypothetical protein
MAFQAALPDRLAGPIYTVQLINILCQIYANSTKLHDDSSFPFAGGIAYCAPSAVVGPARLFE